MEERQNRWGYTNDKYGLKARTIEAQRLADQFSRLHRTRKKAERIADKISDEIKRTTSRKKKRNTLMKVAKVAIPMVLLTQAVRALRVQDKPVSSPYYKDKHLLPLLDQAHINCLEYGQNYPDGRECDTVKYLIKDDIQCPVGHTNPHCTEFYEESVGPTKDRAEYDKQIKTLIKNYKGAKGNRRTRKRRRRRKKKSKRHRKRHKHRKSKRHRRR